MKNEERITRDKILSGKELFKYRCPQDKSVPQRGGAKDFSPDGSWLQEKWLETIRDERKQVLREQRVERHGGLVKGEWDPELNLVQLEKEMGKFWIHMGFVDMSRKWLHPEEALYLMETNVLVVNYKGLPISIQQAYSEFFRNVSLTTDCYHVYAHLRRLGYVVLRHQGKLTTTKYEKKIHLDQHLQPGVKRKKISQEGAKVVDSSDRDDMMVGHKKVKVADDNCETQVLESPSPQINVDQDVTTCCEQKNVVAMETEMLTWKTGKDFDTSPMRDDYSDHSKTFSLDIEKDMTGNKDAAEVKQEASCLIRYSEWNFEEICFPDIGICQSDILTLPKPDSCFLPNGVCPHTVSYDVKNYWNKSAELKMKRDRKNKYEMCVEDLDFSYSEMFNRNKCINAKNWQDYRFMVKEEKHQNSLINSPAKCLWSGEITPLVKPGDARSTAAILEKLQIIQSADCFSHKGSDNLTTNDKHDIVFDVYLPDSKFKKSRPGIPNYRICVMKSSEPPPDLSVVAATNLLDDVPINWAVVDSGEISFYQFSVTSLPLDISMG